MLNFWSFSLYEGKLREMLDHLGLPWLVVVFDDGEVGFVELDLVDSGWGVHHEVDTGTVLGEGDDVANVIETL